MAGAANIHELTRQNIRRVSEIERTAVDQATLAEVVAGRVAAGMGSWRFLLLQAFLMAIWIAANTADWWGVWDPYPFGLLNLLIAFQVACATPIILMSQNRQARLAERRNHLALQINLLAEQENTEQLRLLQLLCDRAGIPGANNSHPGLRETAHPEAIASQIAEHADSTRDQ